MAYIDLAAAYSAGARAGEGLAHPDQRAGRAASAVLAAQQPAFAWPQGLRTEANRIMRDHQLELRVDARRQA